MFLCEEDHIFVDSSKDMRPIRIPLTSLDCDLPGAVASCKSKLTTKLGQKILIKTGILFDVGLDVTPCSKDRHVEFSSQGETRSITDRKCGKISAGEVIFKSVREEMTIKYKSDSTADGVVLYVEGWFLSECFDRQAYTLLTAPS